MHCALPLALLLLGGGVATTSTAAESQLPQSAYVWQRQWNPPLVSALRQAGTNLNGVCVLAAEVGWERKQPMVVRVPVDYAALRALPYPVGLALRIGAFAGPFTEDDEVARVILGLSESILREAKAQQVAVRELQIDFDAAESKLTGYRVWVEAIRRRVAPVPLVITTLPSWLDSPAFAPLVNAADAFVLQVHSFERPADLRAPFDLCVPAHARRAVERAGMLGRPFQVALPTYGYLAAFDAAGKFVGLSAEGPVKTWPEKLHLREVRTDPAAMAELVRYWTGTRPTTLTGIIWYRLPTERDVLNWRWPTLAAVMQGRTPSPKLAAELRRPEAGLVEVELTNTGDADHAGVATVALRWQAVTLLASDALGGFTKVDAAPRSLQLRAQGQSLRLAPGERRTIGWLRFKAHADVETQILPP